jgi:molecular chaperone DnaJ
MNGDLLITIEEVPHPDLVRDGNNVIYNLYLNFADAALGTQIEVPTIDGKASIKVPKGTQSGNCLNWQAKVCQAFKDMAEAIKLWMSIFTRQLIYQEKKLLF